MTKQNNGILPAVMAGIFLIAIAIGTLVYAVADSGILTILWITLMILGLAMCALSGLYQKSETDFGASGPIAKIALGSVLALVGIVGTIATFVSIGLLYIIVILLIGIAAIGIGVALFNNKTGGSQ
jgi:hypothetical protein